MLTKAIEVMKYIRASAGRAGISVVFEDVNQPRHDGKTIFLPRITAKTTDLELQQLMSSVDHEVAHDRFSSFEVLKEMKVAPDGILMFVWNFLEDSRINSIEAAEYRGFRENWDECASILVQQILARAKKSKSPMAVLTTALMCWESSITAPYFPKIELVMIPPGNSISNFVLNVDFVPDTVFAWRPALIDNGFRPTKSRISEMSWGPQSHSGETESRIGKGAPPLDCTRISLPML